MPILTARNIFLIDGFGATATIFFLIVVLRTYEKYFGMPADVLVLLSIIAFIFALYSFTCYLLIDKILTKFLLPIIIANLTYCFLTIILIISNYDKLTSFGITYFIVEILIILMLIFCEYKIFKQKKSEV